MSGTQRAETTHAARPRHTPPCTGRGSPRWESRGRRSTATAAAHPPRTPPCRRRRWRRRASAGRSACRTSTRGTWVVGRQVVTMALANAGGRHAQPVCVACMWHVNSAVALAPAAVGGRLLGGAPRAALLVRRVVQAQLLRRGARLAGGGVEAAHFGCSTRPACPRRRRQPAERSRGGSRPPSHVCTDAHSK